MYFIDIPPHPQTVFPAISSQGLVEGITASMKKMPQTFGIREAEFEILTLIPIRMQSRDS